MRARRHPDGQPTREYRKQSGATVRLLYCPDDPVLGYPLYVKRTEWPRRWFNETLAAGYWPDGSKWELDGREYVVGGAAVEAAD